jgi:hypothetical protein
VVLEYRWDTLIRLGASFASHTTNKSFQFENIFRFMYFQRTLMNTDIDLCSSLQNLPEAPSAVQQGSRDIQINKARVSPIAARVSYRGVDEV